MFHRPTNRWPIVLLGILCITACTAAETKVLYQGKSEYNQILVREDEQGVRTLAFEDGATQSAINTKDPAALVLAYTRASMTALAFSPDPSRILIVGLGGGSMPMYLRRNYPDAQIDAVEIDAAVADVAKRFFEFKEDARMKVHIADGRKFIETTANRYDIIFLDAYGADDIPYALATREFLVAVKARLADGGIVASNVWGPDANKLYHSMVKTYLDVFAELQVIRAPLSANRIVVALPAKAGWTKDRLVQAAKGLQEKLRPELALVSMIESGYQPVGDLPRKAKVLVDADAPRP